MVVRKGSMCPNCGGDFIHYDSVKRIVRTKERKAKHIKIRRLKCTMCGKIHRELPNEIEHFKQYESEIILGVKEGNITPNTIGYEDYPCETTMLRWNAHNQHAPL